MGKYNPEESKIVLPCHHLMPSHYNRGRREINYIRLYVFYTQSYNSFLLLEPPHLVFSKHLHPLNFFVTVYFIWCMLQNPFYIGNSYIYPDSDSKCAIFYRVQGTEALIPLTLLQCTSKLHFTGTRWDYIFILSAKTKDWGYTTSDINYWILIKVWLFRFRWKSATREF